MKVSVKVRLKKSILDTQGKAVNQALHQLGFDQVSEVRMGKLIEMEIEDGLDRQQIFDMVTEASKKLLANTVIEDFEIEYPGHE